MLLSQAVIEVQELTPQLLIFVWGIVQSLGLEYVPGVAPWYSKLDEVQKRAMQAGGLLIVTLSILGLGCASILGGVSCDQTGIAGIFVTYFLALMANQTTHSVFKKRAA